METRRVKLEAQKRRGISCRALKSRAPFPPELLLQFLQFGDERLRTAGLVAEFADFLAFAVQHDDRRIALDPVFLGQRIIGLLLGRRSTFSCSENPLPPPPGSFFAYSANSGFENTSLFSLMHQPHQSEPVKSSMTSFFSVLAWAWALGKSVCHVEFRRICLRERQHGAEGDDDFFHVCLLCYWFVVESWTAADLFCSTAQSAKSRNATASNSILKNHHPRFRRRRSAPNRGDS